MSSLKEIKEGVLKVRSFNFLVTITGTRVTDKKKCVQILNLDK